MENVIRYFMYDYIKNLFDTKLKLYKDTTDLTGFVLKVQEEVWSFGRRFIHFMSLVKIILPCKTVRVYLLNSEIEKSQGKGWNISKRNII